MTYVLGAVLPWCGGGGIYIYTRTRIGTYRATMYR